MSEPTVKKVLRIPRPLRPGDRVLFYADPFGCQKDNRWGRIVDINSVTKEGPFYTLDCLVQFDGQPHACNRTIHARVEEVAP